MRTVTKTIALLVLSVLMSTATFAQKTGFVEVDSLVKWMSESKKAEAILTEYGKGLEKEIISMQQELQKKMADREAAKNAPQIVLNKFDGEISDLSQRIEMFRQQASQDYQQKTMEVSKPIYEKAKKAIEAVAKENGYKYVMDTSSGMVLYSEATDDLMPLVKKKLATMPEAVLPGAPAAAGNTAAATPNGTTPKPKPTPAKPAGK
jgi:outer membrane protein